MAEFGEQVLVFSKADIAVVLTKPIISVTAAQFFTPVILFRPGKTGRV